MEFKSSLQEQVSKKLNFYGIKKEASKVKYLQKSFSKCGQMPLGIVWYISDSIKCKLK